MKKGFSITSRLNDQSVTERMKSKEAYRVEYLALDRIIPAKDNPYRMCDLETLAESIEVSGLLTPVTVKPENDDGKYELISGHRRHAACTKLLEEGHAQVAVIPALVARAGSDAYSRLQLLQANSTARELTPAEKMMQVSEMKEALVQMKAEKHPSLEGKRVRERMAELLEVSPAQVGIMEQIDSNLVPGLKDVFQAGEIGMVQARDLSRMPAQEQEEVLETYREKGPEAIKEATRKPKKEKIKKVRGDIRAGHVNIVHVVLRQIADAIEADKHLRDALFLWDAPGTLRKAADMLEEKRDAWRG